MNLHVGASLILASAVLLLAGCSESGVKCYPVTGTVLLNNQPLPEASVVFHPIGEAGETPRPIAETDAAGRFVLTTFKSGDGAPAGDYQITVTQRKLVQVGEEMIRDGANQLPARYAKPEQSKLTFTVAAGANEVPAIQLTSP